MSRDKEPKTIPVTVGPDARIVLTPGQYSLNLVTALQTKFRNLEREQKEIQSEINRLKIEIRSLKK